MNQLNHVNSTSNIQFILNSNQRYWIFFCSSWKSNFFSINRSCQKYAEVDSSWQQLLDIVRSLAYMSMLSMIKESVVRSQTSFNWSFKTWLYCLIFSSVTVKFFKSMKKYYCFIQLSLNSLILNFSAYISVFIMSKELNMTLIKSSESSFELVSSLNKRFQAAENIFNTMLTLIWSSLMKWSKTIFSSVHNNWIQVFKRQTLSNMRWVFLIKFL